MAALKRFSTVLLFFLLATPAGAQDRASDAAKGTPALNADAFRLPSSAYDTGKLDYDRPQSVNEKFQPGRFDLGDSVLQLDTKRQAPDTRVGIEALDPKRLGGISKDDDSPLPNYFGMTLSKPLN